MDLEHRGVNSVVRSRGGVLLILANPSYHQVTIECPTVGVSQTFMCNKWLAQDEGDGAIERELSGKLSENVDSSDLETNILSKIYPLR